MNRNTLNVGICLVIAVALGTAPLLATDGYCWKSTYGRGVGTIPSDCSFSQEKQGLLCYEKCPNGQSGVGSICSQNCPAGFVDDGLFCRKPAAYGRGSGFAWQAQDGFSSDGMLARCQSAAGQPCEMWGAIAYPTCKAGYHTVGANICSPDCPSNMTDMGVSCTKQTSWRNPITAQCGANQVYDAGLCYTACKAGFDGVGPVCWQTCPADKPVPCGAGCATTMDVCATTTSDMVFGILNMVESIALDVLTGGAGTEALAATRTGMKTATKALTKEMTTDTAMQIMKTEFGKTGKIIKDQTLDNMKEAMKDYTKQQVGAAVLGDDPPDFDWASLDPTGIAPIVQSYNHTICAAPDPNSTANRSLSATIPIPAGTVSQAPSDWVLAPNPGFAAADIAVSGGGTAYITRQDGGIFKLAPGDTAWTQLPGGAARIAAGGDNNLWVANAAGQIYRWNPAIKNWNQIPGFAQDIAVDAVGNAFIIGARGTIWEMKAGQSVWTYMKAPLDDNMTGVGNPVRIAANGRENVWIIDENGLDYRWRGNDNQQHPWLYEGSQKGSGITDVTVGVDGKAFENLKMGNLWRQELDTSRTVLPISLDSVEIASLAVGGTGRVWAVKTDGRVLKYIGLK